MHLNIRSIVDISQFERDLVWPVTEEEKADLLHAIVGACTTYFIAERNFARARILRAFLPMLVAMAYNAAYAGAVVSRVGRRALPIHEFRPSPIDWFSWLIRGSVLDHRTVYAYVSRRANMRNVFRFLPQRLLCSMDFDTMYLTENHTANAYFFSEHIVPTRVFIHDWFPWRMRPARFPNDDVFINSLTDAVWSAVRPLAPDDRVRVWITAFISDNIRMIAGALDDLLRHRFACRTRRLYTATQGYIGTRLVSLAVLERGGEVITFPHSGGLAYVLPQTWMIEPLTTSRFYCYTEAERVMRSVQCREIGTGSFAEFLVLPHGEWANTCAGAARIIRRVLFISGSYLGDRVYVDVLPEPLRFDLELKLIAALLDRGLEVIVKLHRKTATITQQRALFVQRFGSRITFEETPLTELLERGIDVDVVVHENVSGGALIEVMKTDLPMILCTPYLHLLPTDARVDFERRIHVVPCAFDANNRPVFAMADFDRALERAAVSSIDDAYVRRFTNSRFAY